MFSLGSGQSDAAGVRHGFDPRAPLPRNIVAQAPCRNRIAMDEGTAPKGNCARPPQFMNEFANHRHPACLPFLHPVG